MILPLWSLCSNDARPRRAVLWRGTSMFTCLETTCTLAAHHAESHSNPLRAGGVVHSAGDLWKDTGWTCNKSLYFSETGVQCWLSLAGWLETDNRQDQNEGLPRPRAGLHVSSRRGSDLGNGGPSKWRVEGYLTLSHHCPALK